LRVSIRETVEFEMTEAALKVLLEKAMVASSAKFDVVEGRLLMNAMALDAIDGQAWEADAVEQLTL
jgi:hypothetical protein